MIKKVVTQNSKPKYVCEVDKSSFSAKKDELTNKDFKLKEPVINIKSNEICYDAVSSNYICAFNYEGEIYTLIADTSNYKTIYNFVSLERIGRYYNDQSTDDIDGLIWELISRYDVYIMENQLDFALYILMQKLFSKLD